MHGEIHIPPYRLDLETGWLWRGPERVALRAKSFEVLRYLAERPGSLVTKQELLDRVWPDARVADVALSYPWERRGDPARARAGVAAAYEGFTEGFETADLRHAAARLAALA